MTPRIDMRKYLTSEPAQAMFNLTQAVAHSGLELSLIHLVEVRASQINGCAYCIDMHTKDAQALGETEQRLYALNAWRETPFFSERERAALEWIESITRIAETQVPDDLYERVRQHFDEPQLVALTFAAVTINAWNRLAISFRAPAGTYQPQRAHAAV
jgi:AhpD family alkylhydroperoxidase